MRWPITTVLLALLFACTTTYPEPDAGPDVRDGPPAGDDGGTEPDAGWDADDGGDPGTDNGPGCDYPERSPDPRPWTVGGAGTFEALTWNLLNYPVNSQTFQRVADLIWQFDVDLVAVQEIGNLAEFERMMCLLPGYRAELSPHAYSDGTYQKIGFVWREDVLRLVAAKMIFTWDNDFPRPAFQGEFELTLPGKPARTIIAIAVHLKAGATAEDAARRKGALEKLKAQMDTICQKRPDAFTVLVGDMNDDPADPLVDNVFPALLNDPDHYRVLTLPLAQNREYSYIPSRALLDHIVSGCALRPVSAEADILELDQQALGYDYRANVSDHRPAAGIFTFP